MSRYTVAVSDSRHADYEIEREIFRQIDAELLQLHCATSQELIAACANVDGILLDMAPFDAAAAESLPRCRVVNRYGVGYDNVDVEACTRRGIQVTYVPDYCEEDVSDHALALLLSCLRQTALRDRLVRAGQWNIQAGPSRRLAGKTLGILGGGRIARCLIRKVQGFGLGKILVYDPYLSGVEIAALGAEKVDLNSVLSRSDLLSLHMPVTDETRGVINENTLRRMKKGAILVNTARGLLVEDEALVKALKDGTVAFAGLDTHAVEPLPANSPYLQLDNVVLTDHTAYSTLEGVAELKTKAAQNIAAVLAGGNPAYPVNSLCVKGGK